MPLEESYPDEFLRLWEIYPRWKKNRQNKGKALAAYIKAKRVLKFTPEDIEFLANHIERRKQKDVKWQQGNQYGYMAFEVFMNQKRWLDDYETISDKAQAQKARQTADMRPVWQVYGYESAEAYEAAQNAAVPKVSGMLGNTLAELRRAK